MRQKGFTLIELLVALSIGSLFVLVGTAFIFQAYAITRDARSYNTILTELDVVTLQMKRDIYMAHDTDLFDGVPQNSIFLTWANYAALSDSSSEISNSSTYTLSGTNLTRTYVEGDDVSVRILGRNITNITFTQNGRFIDVVITATANATRPISKSIEFSAYRRSTGVN